MTSIPMEYHLSATVQTTDATVTTCGSYTLPDETVALIEARVVGRLSTGTAAGYIRVGTFQQETAGTTVQVGLLNVTNLYGAEDTATWDATLDISGAAVRVRVTGVAATTIDWLAIIDVVQYTP